MSLSVCMIAKNESATIARAISSVRSAADEIVVVDTGSSDDTRQIAQALGARVLEFEWCDDFSAARNCGLERAKWDWILWIDADDAVKSDALWRPDGTGICQLKNDKADCAFDFMVENISPANMDIVGMKSFLQLRMFPNRPDLRFKKRVHEQIGLSEDIDLKMRRFELPKNIIEHYGYSDSDSLRLKIKRNAMLSLYDTGHAVPGEPWCDFSLENHLCLYNSGVLSVFDNTKLIGMVSPFVDSFPEKEEERLLALISAACRMISGDSCSKKMYDEEIARLEKAINKITI